MNEMFCKHLKIEDITGRDIYDHPIYKYFCAKKNKETLYLMCARCKDNTIKKGDNR